MNASAVATRERKALIISDNDRLARAIALILGSCLDIEMIELGPASLQPCDRPEGDADLELIVLALSSALSDPVAVLSRSSPGKGIRQVPVLVISERAYPPDPGRKIFCVDFPFDPHKLCAKAKEILNGQAPLTDHKSRPAVKTL